MPAHLLIADGESGVRAGISAIARAAGHRVSEAGSGAQTLEVALAESPDLVLLDLFLPERSGLEVLRELLALEQPPAVVVLTDHAGMPTAMQAMQRGASNLLQKPVEPDVLRNVLERVVTSRSVRVERDRLRGELAKLRSGAVIGCSPAIRRVMEHVGRVASTPRTTALVSGEPGVGKELVARAIHERSARSGGPFVAVSCAVAEEGQLEAKLFGYEAGLSTGADPKGKDGLLAAAEGGTLLLDEIGEMGPTLQAKLLMLLQDRTYRRIGGTVDLTMNLRVVASTTLDLAAKVKEGAFREDLYYRLSVLTIQVPPLRERTEDVPPIANHFLAQFAEELGQSFTGFSGAALEALSSYPWPGNARELKSSVERAAIQAEEGLICPEHLSLSLAGSSSATDSSSSLALEGWTLKGMEETLIRQALVEFQGNRSLVARELGINRTTLYNKLRVYGIENE